MTPLRRLEGITYRVLEDPDTICDLINTNIRKEWEADVRSVEGDPQKDSWLQTLAKRRWRLETVRINKIELNPNIMNYVDIQKGYSFRERLAQRSQELCRTIEIYDSPIWPVIVRGEDMQLADGCCRYAVLKEMGVSRIYAYVGYR